MDKSVLSQLTPEQAEDNPKFAALLSSLYQFSLSESGILKDLDQMVRATEHEFRRIEEQHRILTILYDKSWDIVIDADKTVPKSEDHKRQSIDDALCWSELKNAGAAENHENFPEQQRPDREATGWLMEKLTHNISQSVLQLSGNGLNPAVPAKDSMTSQHITKRLKQRYGYFELLVQILSHLEGVIKTQILEHQSKQTETLVNFAVTKLDSLLLKMQTFKLEILCETYKKETVAALKVMKKQVDQQTEQLRSQVELSEGLLQRYSSIGQEFNELIAEYTNILENIKQKTWTLEKLDTYK